MATPTSLPATFVAGNVLTAAQMNDLRGAFRILQVVTSTHSTEETTTSATYVDTSLTATITPSATTSKVLAIASIPAGVTKTGANSGRAVMAIERGGTQLAESGLYYAASASVVRSVQASISLIYLDSPATTSATDYTVQHKQELSGTSYAFVGNLIGTLTLMEVSA